MPNMNPKKLPAREQAPDVRNKNFDEVSQGYDEAMAMEEAARCLNCKHRPCVSGCPVNVRIPEFIQLVKDGKFLEAYYNAKIFENDPFARLDRNGVGRLMEMSVKLGRSVRPDMHMGICGEHGGDPTSIEFCHKIGLDYVSCSPFRVPIARLAAAQARIRLG